MKKKQKDLLTQKSEKLSELARQADSALDLVTRTISGLELVNQEIEDEVSEIDKYRAELGNVRDRLSENREHNARIIENFTKLISGE